MLAVWTPDQNGWVSRRLENSDCSSPEWLEKASWTTQLLLDGPGWPLWRTTYLCTTLLLRMLSKWPWISCCGDYWQQAELRTDGACRIMMMMMMKHYLWEWGADSTADRPYTHQLKSSSMSYIDVDEVGQQLVTWTWQLSQHLLPALTQTDGQSNHMHLLTLGDFTFWLQPIRWAKVWSKYIL